ncbi:hypothetical protein K469DRAFT_712897 [Zopfia rhizophila CBS 207.26]|uniref:DNA replication ATP-dependent helicase/nuclease n=1 Tax=Zopfia rhizophila CBS 207.26 TaxID=1314779 RepID=A0A6A6DRS3_9PEZI|nr:hypothetical protein K469DRAFT_712897 [Zopfia rhizophila CBS 207.26]
MCADIMLLSNTFIYSGRLKCGTHAVADRKLSIPKPSALLNHHHKFSSKSLMPALSVSHDSCLGPETTSCWLARTLDPNNPVVFLNTDTISTSLETAAGSRITNTLEARLVTHLTLSLLSVGIPANDIGVIAFYRSQLALLRSSLQSAHTTTQTSGLAAPATGQGTAAIELHTADKFQGRDKEVILVSCVRSNEDGIVGDLLKDRRRVNVALTRARSKIVILGSEKTLGANELLKRLVALCRERGWVFDLSQDMLEGHVFDEGGTQTGRTPASVQNPSLQANGNVEEGRSPSASPGKRKVLGDVTSGGNANRKREKKGSKKPSSSPEVLRTGMKSPGRVFKVGKRGVLDGRPVLRDVFNGAM